MVKTRHSVEVNDTPTQFISLQRRSTRSAQKFEQAEFSSCDSDDGDYIPRKSSKSLRKCDDSPRTGSPKRSSKRRRLIEDESADEEPDLIDDHAGTTSRRRNSRMDNGEAESYGMIRRSTRNRTSMYDSLNQSLIIDNAALGLVDMDGDMPASSREPARQKRCRRQTRKSKTEYEEAGGQDMYSRIKGRRRILKRDMYGIPLLDQGGETEGSDMEHSNNDEQADNEQEEGDEPAEQDDDDDDEDEMPQRRSYFLREHKPRTQIYEAPPIGPQMRRSTRNQSLFQDPSPRPMQHKTRDHPAVYRSPARRNSIRRKAAFHGSSSTSSSDPSSSSDDEERFERRKAKSMAEARNRCLPMNLDPEDLSSGLRKERARIGSSLADVDPMTIDRSVTFETVGGLEKHIRALKEMVVFPLLYPEVFEKFKISPPRGVLFYGPPGTGKTLVARALANECSRDDKRVAFFMRKGADCLSKWVGESERQLRLLFDQAYQMRPAILFFDEIDGLAPVRSSRQDQIHSSIVSTLLALMDGLDSRGEIVIIGATNRIDSIDPALRRPGRFDREFLFPLPSLEARQQILKIHTRAWTPKLADPFLGEVAERCVGYCGADVKALCTEAALLALRRRYPQIYNCSEKLELDVSSINVSAKDFHNAMQAIVPTAQRATTSPARSLCPTIRPLLKAVLEEVLTLLQSTFPNHATKQARVDKSGASCSSSANADGESTQFEEELCSDDDDNAQSIFEITPSKNGKKTEHFQGTYMSFTIAANKCAVTHRPRLLLSGVSGQGQTTHVAPAVLYHLERLPVHVLDLPAMFANSSKTPEEACAQIFREARRTAPCILYIPHISQWWSVLSETLQATFLTLVQDLDPSTPVLILATSDLSYLQLDEMVQELFDNRYREVVSMRNPSTQERREYFTDLIRRQSVLPPARKKQAALRALEVLPKAPPAQPKELTAEEQRKLKAQEEATSRELRIFLRDALNKIARDRKFNIFAKPVDIEEVPDYYEIIKKPMDLQTMMTKIDLHHYQMVKEFVTDIEQICSNALEYNPDKAPGDRAIRHRACALRDMAFSIVKNELDPEFDKICEEMAAARKKRGEMPAATAPDFYFTKPLQKPSSQNLDELPPEYPSRFSKRTRGMDAPEVNELIEVKKPRIREQESSPKSSNEISSASVLQKTPNNKTVTNKVKNKPPSSSKRSNKKPKRCIWSYKSRKRRRMTPFNARRCSLGRAVPRRSPPAKAEATEDSSGQSGEDEEVVFIKPVRDVTFPLHDNPDEEGDSSDTVIEYNSAPSQDNEPMDTEEETKDGTISPSSEGGDEDTQEKKSPSQGSSGGKPAGSPSKMDFTSLKLGQEATATVVAIDSGIGSSVDSNGESMDSIDQIKQQSSSSVCATVVESSQEQDKQKDATTNCDGQESASKPGDNSEEVSPSFRMTRSRMQSKEVQRALEILEEPEPPLVVDHERLDALLTTVVHRTHDYSVDRLGKLYSQVSRCIYQHRFDYDKTNLIRDMESAVEHYTSGPAKGGLTPSSHSTTGGRHTPGSVKHHMATPTH